MATFYLILHIVKLFLNDSQLYQPVADNIIVLQKSKDGKLNTVEITGRDNLLFTLRSSADALRNQTYVLNCPIVAIQDRSWKYLNETVGSEFELVLAKATVIDKTPTTTARAFPIATPTPTFGTVAETTSEIIITTGNPNSSTTAIKNTTNFTAAIIAFCGCSVIIFMSLCYYKCHRPSKAGLYINSTMFIKAEQAIETPIQGVPLAHKYTCQGYKQASVMEIKANPLAVNLTQNDEECSVEIGEYPIEDKNFIEFASHFNQVSNCKTPNIRPQELTRSLSSTCSSNILHDSECLISDRYSRENIIEKQDVQRAIDYDSN
ncbi:uncharacterized protein TRIADDRAFT_51328 [Trichoplax adhaerens]|uniref:Cadherin domain-containing protein n=1 Tax=Trichoplax adhaerens TaxID=10228 RepID=B3RII3_TRIAD|nr:predicted protein [Trichoplax adhaerens]EDV28426.1 predicted protein [Trichoplax adhaerens]|eukprot:XP_002107628.1 predicted protein [Trichoplax adhaerens]